MPYSPPTFRASHLPSRQQRNREHDQRREEWRNWYNLAAWARLRQAQLTREPLCANCLCAHEYITAATVVHHIDPHRGDRAKFFDPANLESACKACHDGEIQRGERLGWTDRGWSVEGQRMPPRVLQPLNLQPSLVPLTMVCGPPGSGKSTYVHERKGENDWVIDIDLILNELSGVGVRTQERRDRYLVDAFVERNRRLAALSGPGAPPAAWFLIGAPRPEMRELWARQLKPVCVVVMEVKASTCIERIRQQSERSPTADGMIAGVRAWWERYERSMACDTVRIIA